MTTLVERIIKGNDRYVEISGDSTDTKPTANIVDGSLFVESNTGDVYLFNEESGDWVKQFSLQG